MTRVASPRTAGDPAEVRSANPRDADAIGRVLHAAFSGIAERHGFPSDFPSAQYGIGLARALLSASPYRGVVAEQRGRVVGAAFVNVADPVRGIGPVGVSPRAQASGAGRALMKAVVEAGEGGAGLRLTQDLFNMTSLSLYASLGFEAKEALVLVHGRPRSARRHPPPPGCAGWRTATSRPARNCASGCTACPERGGGHRAACRPARRDRRARGASRRVRDHPELVAARARGRRAPRGPRGPAARSRCRAASRSAFLIPIRDAGLHRWCLDEGLEAVKPMTLMARGTYSEPRGAWLPSVAY